MIKLLFAAAVMLWCAPIDAQERARPDVFQDANVMAWLNRAASSISLVDGESRIDSDLQLTESQKLQIKEIVASHQEMMSFGDEVPPEKAADKQYVNEIFSFYISELKSLEASLTEKVLLPNQVSLLSQKLFLQAVKMNNGDVLKVITENYCDKIKLDDKRKDKLAEIGETAKKEIAEAKKKFEAELKRILDKGDKATRDVLTGQEKDMLGLSGD